MAFPKIQELIAGVPHSLGCYGPVIQEIEAALNDPQGSLVAVGATIEKDPDLTARLLRLGNSSYYGFPTRLATVSEAISLIGVQQVQDLIVASTVVQTFSGVAPEFVDMRSFWQHSLACGLGARVLAMDRRLPKPDRFFVAGLLHDVGRLVLFCEAPEAARDTFALCQHERMQLREAERQVLGYDHAQIGEVLLRAWQYPANLIQAVAYHHHPTACEGFPIEAAVVHVADHLVNAMQIGTSGERWVPALHLGAWNRMELALTTLSSVMAAIDDQLEAVQETFLNVRGATSPP